MTDICYICRDDDAEGLVKCPQCTTHVHIQCATTGFLHKPENMQASMENPVLHCNFDHPLSYTEHYRISLTSRLTASYPDRVSWLCFIDYLFNKMILMTILGTIIGEYIFIYGILVAFVHVRSTLVLYTVRKKSLVDVPFPFVGFIVSFCCFIPARYSNSHAMLTTSAICYAIVLMITLLVFHQRPIMMVLLLLLACSNPGILCMAGVVGSVYCLAVCLFQIQHKTNVTITPLVSHS